MTHFTVAIIVPPDEIDTEIEFVENQMQPYDGNLAVAPYVCYSLEQAATDIADAIRRLELIISRNEADYDIDKCRTNLAELRGMTPKEKYRQYTRLCETFNAQGKPISRHNPAGKWDWYVIGGRWDGWINDRETAGQLLADNMAIAEEVLTRNKIPHAIITPDGFWHEHGRMGWWGVLTTENEDWDAEALRLFAQYPDHRVVLIDAHI